MKATVIIPTTTRPVLISGLQERPNIKASMVVAEGDFRGLPISDDYDRLIGVSGPLSTIVGRPGLPPHMLRLSHAFESGRSWEVPVCIAHFLSSRGVTLVRDPAEADLVCWATGAVDSDLSVVPDRYFLDQKLSASLDLLRNVPAKALTIVLLPKGNGEDRIEAKTHASLRELDASVSTIACVDDATAAIQKLVGSLGSASSEHADGSRQGEADPRKKPGRTREPQGDEAIAHQEPPGGRRWLAAVLVFLLATAGVAWGTARIVFGPTWYTTTKDKEAAGSDKPGAKTPGTSVAAYDSKPDGKANDASSPRADTSGKATMSEAGTVVPSGASGIGKDGNTRPAGTVVAEGPGQDGKAADTGAGPAATSTTVSPTIINPSDKGKADSTAASPAPGGPTAASGTSAEAAATDARPVEPKAEDKAADRTAAASDGLLLVEEWRVPAGGSCQDLLYQSQQPVINALKPNGGRLEASSVQGLCALAFRLTESGRGYAVIVDRRLSAMTMDAPPSALGRGQRRGNEVVRFFRGRDSGQGLTYDIVLRPSNPSANSGEVRFTHELRR